MTYEIGSRYPEKGDKVKIVEKKNYASGQLAEGIVKDVLTSKKFHPRGHKVRLTSGIIGRVQGFVGEEKNEEELSIHYPYGKDDLV